MTPDRARAEAAAASDRARAWSAARAARRGAALVWKDLFDSAGDETKAGSDLLAGRVPEADAEVLAGATRAGAVCLGKTHMSELAFSGIGLNPVTATPPNMHDPALVPGGSSSGSAAATAFGLAPAGIGTDTGGSVRVPSAWNDLVGLKTTSGRLSLAGVVPLCEKFDTVGPLARTVEDCALLLAAMEGGKPADLAGASLEGRRFLVLDTYTDDVREGPAKGFAHALDRMARAGAQDRAWHGRRDRTAMDLSPILFTSEAYGTWKHVIESDPDKMFAPILDRFRSGARYGAADYVAAWQLLDRLRGDWAAAVAGYRRGAAADRAQHAARCRAADGG